MDFITYAAAVKAARKGVPYVEGNVLLEETNASSFTHPTLGQAWMILDVTLNLTVGETYTIVYNGTPYQCVCQTAPDGFTVDPDAVAMGNFAAIGGTNTGEPFALLYQPNYQEMAILDFVGSQRVNIGILDGTIRQIDPRCLPVFIVNINMAADLSSGTADKTADEIYQALVEGKSVLAYTGARVAPCIGCDWGTEKNASFMFPMYNRSNGIADSLSGVVVLCVNSDGSVVAGALNA